VNGGEKKILAKREMGSYSSLQKNDYQAISWEKKMPSPREEKGTDRRRVGRMRSDPPNTVRKTE